MEPGTTIDKWQQAFEGYRIPQTRSIEKQLRSNAAQNKEKLRTLVGGSYRELLATAQAIVTLDEQTRVIETHLSSIGHNCRPPRLNPASASPPNDKVLLAEHRLLQRCCTTIASGIRQQNLLQCARLIVVSRLLLKSMGDLGGATKSIELLRNKLTHLRRQLLMQINSRLSNPATGTSDLVESLCSYALISSSSTEDAQYHLRHIRLEKLRSQLTASDEHVMICGALRYQISSLRTFRVLYGRPLVEAMNDLQKKPILTDPSIKNLESLGLDRLLSLIPDDIRTFVPYFRRNAPTADEMRSRLEDWSRETCRILCDTLRQSLSSTSQLSDVLELRRQLYTILLPAFFSTPAGPHIQKQVALVIDESVRSICQTQGGRLKRSTNLLLEGEPGEGHDHALWKEDLALASLDVGGDRYIKQVSQRHSGYSVSHSKASRTLQKWISESNLMSGQIEEVSKTRWRDILEEPDEENEEDAAILTKTLGERDPKDYSNALQRSLQSAVEQHEKAIVESATNLAVPGRDIAAMVALLRSVRLSISSLQQGFSHQVRFEQLQEVLPDVQSMVANKVCQQALQATQSYGKGSIQDKTILPENMPSPRAFSTLRRLCKVMVDVGGSDLWSPPMVDLVKTAASTRVFDPEHKALYMDHDFDEAYLSIALRQSSGGVAEDVAKDKALVKSATDYWTRTKLLFGVLA